MNRYGPVFRAFCSLLNCRRLALFFLPGFFLPLCLAPLDASPLRLTFSPEGNFTIVQFTDIQECYPVDGRTIRLMEAVLDEVNPGLVVITGDMVSETCTATSKVSGTIDEIAAPMIERQIPWIVTFGNHDEDHTPSTGMDADAMLALYMSLPFNMNKPSPRGISGCGVMSLPLHGTRDNSPALILWCLDSGRYAPQEPLPVPRGHKPDYMWIEKDQILWYSKTSMYYENLCGRKIPGLMFFHIPLAEFEEMWSLQEIYPVSGEMNEEVSAPFLNSGLMKTVLNRGDIRGIFTGHDHVNDFQGIYRGVLLAYGSSAGFGTYGLKGKDPHRLRGARIIRINNTSGFKLETRMIYARDLGIK